MMPYVPSLHDLLGAFGVALAVALLFVIGALVTRPRSLPAIQLLAGWGLVSIVFTLWAVLTPWPLALPLAGLGAVALAAVAWPRLRRRCGALGGAARLLLLTVPLWLVMLPAQPSEVDTWLNLLPNAAYLFDHGRVPWAGGPPSYSFLPGAPYNTQFIAFIASVASGSFAENAMSLFNIVLQLSAALLLAHVVAGQENETDARPPWWACAAGFLLAIPLNPGFVPRVFFAPYGEAPLAVTTLYAAWLAVATVKALERGIAWPAAAGALALVLVALVNTKQSGPGLVAPIGITMFVLVLLHPRLPRRQGVIVTAAAMIPAAVLFLLWNAYVHVRLPGGALALLPVSSWNLDLPAIAAAILDSMVKKATYFLFEAATLAAAVWQLRRDPWSERGLLLALCLGIIPLYNVFLVFTYIAHFAEEHSYFRYSTHLSLLMMLALTATLRPAVARWIARADAARRRLFATAAIALVLVLPVAFVGFLRFDLAPPLPEFSALGHRIARFVKPGGRLALLLPGDNGSVASMLRGVILFTPPRRPDLTFRVEDKADAATLDAVGKAGYTLAFLSCTPPGLDGTPAKVAALMTQGRDGWHPLAVWHYPPDLAQRHFTSLARGPACAGP